MKKIFFIALILRIFPAISCECIREFSEFSPHVLMDYNHIFSGTPLSSDTFLQKRYVIYKVLVSKTYWGQKGDTVYIRTASGISPGMCAFPVEMNSEYLFYGNGDNIIDISSCDGSRELNLSVSEELKSFSDSIYENINFEKKNYSKDFIIAYYEKSHSNEIKWLDSISKIHEGQIITYFMGGKTSALLSFKNGRLNGKSIFYFTNGKEKSEGIIIDNFKEGKWKEYKYKHPTPKQYFYAIQTGIYEHGVMKGVWNLTMVEGRYDDFYHYYHIKKTTNYE